MVEPNLILRAKGQGNEMNGRSIAKMMIIGLALTAGGAEAGVLKGGAWEPTGCGTEPTPPKINGSSAGAYQSSIKEANAYQTAAKAYDDCYFKEANTDNQAISTATQDHQAQLKAAFDKLQADAKAAADRLNKKQ